MAERTDQLTETRSADHEVDLDGSSEPPRGRIRERAGTLFSPKRFLVALALVAVGVFVGGATIPLAGGLLGAFIAAFLLGVASERRPMAEAGTASAAVLGLSTVFDSLAWILADNGLAIVALGAVLGLVLGALGAYFGSDLRDGLTREL
ncbi:hypothetical protein HAPAU_15760 [Halalkalicoccus paucihalophilus]|uniref:DUF456 domain-containing protein n=1 Tax=Halalkalicoccus paucihalophilus TaxID=1008153 RepID=A0A151AFQ0_9EURY|nr:hypothetical protein [Halalkalicoccus paucihalophilus]KYH26478.1 hypothetical protein HAPAU_15760 [Halalkalicoccus paucihalophilus]